jgi:hypothetical protein
MDEIKQDILNLAKKKMRESGEYSREAYRQFIEESIEYYLEKDRLTEEDDLDAIQEELMEMYNDIEDEEADDDLDIGDEEALKEEEEEMEEEGEREDKVEPLEDEEKY